MLHHISLPLLTFGTLFETKTNRDLGLQLYFPWMPRKASMDNEDLDALQDGLMEDGDRPMDAAPKSPIPISDDEDAFPTKGPVGAYAVAKSGKGKKRIRGEKHMDGWGPSSQVNERTVYFGDFTIAWREDKSCYIARCHLHSYVDDNQKSFKCSRTLTVRVGASSSANDLAIRRLKSWCARGQSLSMHGTCYSSCCQLHANLLRCTAGHEIVAADVESKRKAHMKLKDSHQHRFGLSLLLMTMMI